MRVCQNCGKKAQVANLVSHSHHKVKRLQRANLHAVTLLVGGIRQKMLLCSSCLKKAKVQLNPKPQGQNSMVAL